MNTITAMICASHPAASTVICCSECHAVFCEVCYEPIEHQVTVLLDDAS
ncbi:hypothetical protein [Geodermatophilus sp. DSM 45219]|nr:hypothetical protein [Geodermatophilus sp. DSM 45219]SDN79477.1 hypothetical protein SAMN05428965_1657 [Geodermatophilus sp. DSM 45219]